MLRGRCRERGVNVTAGRQPLGLTGSFRVELQIESTMTVLVLLLLLLILFISLILSNFIKSWLFTVGDSGDSLLVFLPVRPSSSTWSWSSGNSSPSLSSVASSVPWENSLFFTANKSDNRVRTTPQRGHPRALKFQPFQRLYKIYKFGFWFPYILFVECWFRLAWSFGSSWTCTTQCCSADAQYSAVK